MVLSRVALLCTIAATVAEEGSGTVDESYNQGAACYGFGGGHGVWKCGTSKAWCDELGGVGWYAAGYESCRGGACTCMCETGCTTPSAIVPGFTKGNSHDGFACYNTDGTHNVMCGVSAADCAGMSGSSFAPATVYNGCCMCDENCDHSQETDSSACTYGGPVGSPTPPPLPPSPPPSPMFPPVLGDSGNYFTITTSMKVSGDLSDYPDSKKALIAAKFAVMCGVHADDITVSFAAGSVIITVEIKVPDQAAATKVTTTVNAAMASPATALAAMGGAYGSILYRKSVLTVTAATVDETKTDDSLPVGALIGIIIGCLFAVAFVGFYVKGKIQNSKSGGKGVGSAA
jgi:hypothetical protein